MRKIIVTTIVWLLSIPNLAFAVNWNAQAPYLLFDPPRPTGTFAYAPASISEYPYDYHFYCGNTGNNEIKDHIYVRRYYWNGASWVLQNDQVAIAPSAGRWDSVHVCDPAVVKGAFNMDGITYAYALFYTGTQDPYQNGTQNSVGVAFSNDLMNWVKHPTPLIKMQAAGYWGVGQPAVTSVNGAGNVLLFATRDDMGLNRSATFVSQYNLSNMASPQIVTPQWLVPEGGLSNIDGTTTTLGTRIINADFVYDSANDRFYMVRPALLTNNPPTWITDKLEVAYISGASMWAGSGNWTSVKFIDSPFSGKGKNFDAGFQRGPYGTLPTPGELRVNFSGSDISYNWPAALWTYRIYSTSGPLQ